jgi:hypothetical protein
MGAIRTGVMATATEIAEAKQRAVEAREAPVAKVGGVWLYEAAHENFMGWLDRLAVAHGLPEPPRDPDGDVVHYGLLGTGEFTKWDGRP